MIKGGQRSERKANRLISGQIHDILESKDKDFPTVNSFFF